MTMTENELQDGRVVAIAGPVIDVEFPRGALPELNSAIEFTITLEGEETTVLAEVADAERALFYRFQQLRGRLAEQHDGGDYAAAFETLAQFTPVMARYFEDVYVMDDDVAVRDSRLRLMRTISETCSTLADLHLLGVASGE